MHAGRWLVPAVCVHERSTDASLHGRAQPNQGAHLYLLVTGWCLQTGLRHCSSREELCNVGARSFWRQRRYLLLHYGQARSSSAYN